MSEHSLPTDQSGVADQVTQGQQFHTKADNSNNSNTSKAAQTFGAGSMTRPENKPPMQDAAPLPDRVSFGVNRRNLGPARSREGPEAPVPGDICTASLAGTASLTSLGAEPTPGAREGAGGFSLEQRLHHTFAEAGPAIRSLVALALDKRAGRV